MADPDYVRPDPEANNPMRHIPLIQQARLYYELMLTLACNEDHPEGFDEEAMNAIDMMRQAGILRM